MILVDDLSLDRLERFARAMVFEPFGSLGFAAPPIVFGLTGTLGVGKTRLTQAIAGAAGVDPTDVTSPTFTLLQSHVSKSSIGPRMIHHLDAYRLRDADEFWELGVDELWQQPSTWTIVEWADRVEDEMPPFTIWAELDVMGQDTAGAMETAEDTALRQLRLSCDESQRIDWLRRCVARFDSIDDGRS
ncbi:MAG: tRNA (adenosine(37)-N6)-threonylcarbamoyltransferase complex ATPase subunit type 1 TsaE [Planctomycetota bacterium]